MRGRTMRVCVIRRRPQFRGLPVSGSMTSRTTIAGAQIQSLAYTSRDSGGVPGNAASVCSASLIFITLVSKR